MSVFANSHYWTTHIGNDIAQCSIFLAYRGNMDFDDTKPMTQDQFKASAEPIGWIQAKIAEAKPHEKQGMQLHSKRKRAFISSNEEDINLKDLLKDG